MDPANDVNDGARPPKAAQHERRMRRRYAARLDGAVLAISRDAALPAVCLKCGTHEGVVPRETDFEWTPLWSRLLVFCAVGLLTRFFTREYATLDVPLCVPCTRRWNEARTATIGGIVALVLSVVFVRTRANPRSFAFVVLGTIAAFVGVVLFYVRPRLLQVDRIDDAEVRFKGFAAGAAREIVEKSARPRAAKAEASDQ